MRPGTVVVDAGSSAPAGTATVGAALAERGVEMVDAPVSGGVARARTGELTAMAGGDPGTLARCRPLLDAFAARVLETGPLGSGHATKALNNYVSAAGLLAALEALTAAERVGLDPAVVLAALNASSGRNNSTETKIAQFVLSETFGSGFALGLMAKDVRTAQQVARDAGVPARLLDACALLWDEAAAWAADGADHTEVGRALGLSGAGRP
jgi:3-hydroxyisobutyrate dehydrogenase